MSTNSKSVFSLPSYFFSKVQLAAFKELSIDLWNHSLAQTLHDLPVKKDTMISYLKDIKGGYPIALAYAGHQYGHFSMLGDGRASLIKEVIGPSKSYDLHLKGSGKTPYSRGFDGRATLRSTLLEYLMSEAMHYLNIPTSRTLAIIKTGEKVKRFKEEEGSMLLRIASSHLRVGTVQYASVIKQQAGVKEIIDLAIRRHDEDLVSEPNRYIKWYNRTVKRQAELVAKWQSVGFVHGVLNTDNTSLCGESIDYGPCAFLDQYDLNAVYSSIDHSGYYAFNQQPYRISWNMAKLGEMILPIISEDKTISLSKIKDVLGRFGDYFETAYYHHLAQKIGIKLLNDSDKLIINDLLKIMEDEQLDYTNTFLYLMGDEEVKEAAHESESFKNWVKLWKKRLESEGNPSEIMKKSNPKIIPRNHLVKQALDDVEHRQDYSLYLSLLELLRNPYSNDFVKAFYKKVPQGLPKHITFCGT